MNSSPLYLVQNSGSRSSKRKTANDLNQLNTGLTKLST